MSGTWCGVHNRSGARLSLTDCRSRLGGALDKRDGRALSVSSSSGLGGVRQTDPVGSRAGGGLTLRALVDRLV